MSFRRRGLSITVLLPAVLATGWVVWYTVWGGSGDASLPPGRTARAGPDGVADGMRDLQTALRMLTQRLARLELRSEAKQAAATAVVAAAVPVAVAECVADPPTPQVLPTGVDSDPRSGPIVELEDRRDALERVALQAVAYEALLAAEAPDAAWAYRAERALADAARTAELGQAVVRRVECRSSMCVTALSFRAVEERERFFNSAPHHEPWRSMGEAFLYCEGWDDTEVEVFVARDGTLPDPTGWMPEPPGPEGSPRDPPEVVR